MRRIKQWAIATFVLTFLVILAGSIVRTTHSGMGCPDWPRCFGRWIPPTDASQLPPDFEKYLKKQDIDHSFNAFHTWIEYVNRLLGMLLGIFALVQLALVYRKRKIVPAGVYRMAIAFLAVVIITGLFGALVVKFNLAHVSVSVHMLLALVLTQVELALIMFLQRKVRSVHVTSPIKNILFALLVFIFLQSALGTGVRMFVDEISASLDYQQRELWLSALPTIFLVHRSFSWLVLAATIWATWKFRNNKNLFPGILRLLLIVICSVVTGIVLFYLDMPAIAQPAHLLLASLAITQATALLLLATKKEKRFNDF